MSIPCVQCKEWFYRPVEGLSWEGPARQLSEVAAQASEKFTSLFHPLGILFYIMLEARI